MSESDKVAGGNVGEWSEVYVFFRLLGEHEICACDENLSRTDEVFPILKIFRGQGKETTVICTYDEAEDSWEVYSGTSKIVNVSSLEGKTEADDLLTLLKNKDKWPGKYSKAAKFLSRLNIDGIKADSQRKQDIALKISDIRAGTAPTCGFSIKSYLGKAPTLLNSSGDCTNFLYEVEGVSVDGIEKLNELDKIEYIIREIESQGGNLIFKGCCRDVFSMNLEQIDTSAEKILGELVRMYYSGKGKGIETVTEQLMSANPFQFLNPRTYKMVVKRLLDTVALGMTPGHDWNGETDRTNGIIIVKKDGEVVTYHIYNRDAFKQYLYMQTSFESPSRSRHKYGKLYLEAGKICIKLALQIRFK